MESVLFLRLSLWFIFTGSSELHESCGRGDESTKKGACLLEIKRTGMIQWGVSRHIEFIDSPGENNPQFPPAIVEHGQKNPQPPSASVKHGKKNTQLPSAVVKHGKNNPQFPSAIVKEDLKVGEDGIESFVLPEAKKRKCHALSERREAQAVRRSKAKKTSLVYKSKQIKRENSISIKKENVKDRWSVDRYRVNHYSFSSFLFGLICHMMIHKMNDVSGFEGIIWQRKVCWMS